MNESGEALATTAESSEASTRRPPLLPRQSLGLIAAVVVGVVLADQATKSWAVSALRSGPREAWGPLSFTLAFNKGSSFSLLFGPPWLYIALAVGMTFALVAFSRDTRRTRVGASIIGLIAAGALGNGIDRLFRDTDGAVVDFVKFGWWPIFNVADAAIVIGLIGYLFVSSRQAPRRHVPTT